MRFPSVFAAFLAVVFLLAGSGMAMACGTDTDCVVNGDRTYRIKMPDSYDGVSKIGAIVFVHGFRGSAAGVMRNKSLLKVADDLGVALIAVKSGEGDWELPGAPHGVSTDGAAELAYFDSVVADAAARFPIDTERMMATGFSAGGMMVWNLICNRSELFAAFAPMAGTFWRPEPETCTTPATSVLHIHGDADRTVPLKGRKIQNTYQGDVLKVLDMYARYGGFGPATEVTRGDWRCKNRTNADGQFLDFCLFKGGHSFKSSYVKRAWERFVEAGKL